MARTGTSRTKNTTVEKPETEEKETTVTNEPEVEKDVHKSKEKEDVQKVKEKENVLDVNSVEYVKKCINKAKTVDELLNLVEANKDFITIVARLRRYIKNINSINKPDDVVAEHYNIYNLIKEILNNEDYNTFRIKYDFLNKVFLLGKDTSFNPINMSKYDYLWKWSKKSHKEYHKLVELISSLSNPKTRRNTLKTVDFNNGLIEFPDQIRQNLSKYYTMGQ